MPAVPVALAARLPERLAAPADELARAVAVKPHAPISRPRMAEWHPGPSTRWQPLRSAASDSGRQDYTRPHDSPGGQDEHPGT